MNIGPARPASTIVLLRPSARRFDVCLVRRHDEVAFMGGAYVFPGGRVDESDRVVDPDTCCDGAEAAVQRMSDVAPADAIGHHVAAIREMFEEAGVLLARRAGGAMLRLHEPAESGRFKDYRSRLLAGTLEFGEIVARERLQLALDALVLFGHWVTPEVEIKRYDARFFLAVAPEGQEPVHDDHETVDALWLDPAEAVNRCRRDEIMLAPPTWTALRTLERFSTVDEAIQWARGTQAALVQPRLFEHDNRRMLALPGDEWYPPVEGFETPRETRFVFDKGRWKAIER